MKGTVSGPITAGMRRAIRCPEATSCHHVPKSKTSAARVLSHILMPDVPLNASLSLGGTGAERNLVWVQGLAEY
jgi:hypothetical protein